MSALQSIPATSLWGLFFRLLGAIYAFSFLSLDREILALAGSRGISPIALQLARIRQDFPGVIRFFRFPTLLWVTSSDTALRCLLWLGALAGLLAAFGGPAARPALFLCFALYLSFDLAADLLYPWDCLLFEAGFLALFLPDPRTLPDLALSSAPHPAIAWTFRWLLFRVVFGFGKYKFFGPGKTDFAYLHGFLSSQPLPTPLGFRAGTLPLAILKLAYVGVFVVEVLAPFFFFVPGAPRVVAACLVLALMAGIQLCGNFGFFNLIAAVLCVPLFDAPSSLTAANAADLVGSPWAVLCSGVALCSFFCGLVQLPFNSWVTRAWPFWPGIDGALGGRLRPLLAVLRAIVPFRLTHAFGVFGPESGPPVKWVPVVEGTRDGITWRIYPYRYMSSGPGSRPRFVAPFCPRLDHATIYDAYGIRLSAHLGSAFSLGHPYRFSRASAMDRLLARVLEGSPDVLQRFRCDPFAKDGPPIAVRARLAVMLPATRDHIRATGDPWILRWVMPHGRVLARGDDVFADWLRPPELFHPDDLVWAQRAPALAGLIRAARAGDMGCLTDEEKTLLWDRLGPVLGTLGTCSLADVQGAAKTLADAVPLQERAKIERALGRAALALTERERTAREETKRLGGTHARDAARSNVKPDPTVAACPPSHFEHHLAALAAIAKGREAFEAVLAKPSRLCYAAGDPAVISSGLFVLALFWPDAVAYHAERARLRDVMWRGAIVRVPKIAPGFLRLLPKLASEVRPSPDERLPSFMRSERGDYRLLGPIEAGARIAS